jgi:hypothetical protein
MQDGLSISNGLRVRGQGAIVQGRCSDGLQALLRDIYIAQARGQTELLTELGNRVGSGQTGRV